MDLLSLLRMFGALLLVLGMLVCALWAVRRYDLTLPRAWLERLGNTRPDNRLEVVERLAVDQRRSFVLLRRDDVEFSVVIGPEGVTLLDSAAVARPTQVSAEPQCVQTHAVEGDLPHTATAETPACGTPAFDTPAPSFADRIAAFPEVWFTQDAKAELH